MRRRRRSMICEAAPSVLRNESTGSTTGIAVPCSAAAATVRRISSCDPSGRTPSCTAISSGSRFRAANPFFTEWNRSRPPSAIVCGATSKRADRLCQKPVCSAGSTTTISAPGSAAAKLLIVRANMGMPPSSMNCLGRAPPMRLPPPPATMMTPVCRSISVSFQNRAYCRSVSYNRALSPRASARPAPHRETV